MKYQIVALLTGLLVSSQSLGGHQMLLGGVLAGNQALAEDHHASEHTTPIAKPGQIVVVFEVPCTDSAQSLAILNELIAYEAVNSPIAYSSVAVSINESTVGAIDVHESMAAMEQAFAWQEGDETWTALQAKAFEACSTSLDQLTAKIYNAH